MVEREVLENRELIKIEETVFKLEDAVKCVIEDEKIILWTKNRKSQISHIEKETHYTSLSNQKVPWHSGWGTRY